MRFFFKSISLLFCVILACSSSKKTSEHNAISKNNTSSNNKMMTTEHKNTNFKNGVIIAGEKNSTCSFLIKLYDNTLLDPINLEENYKINQLKIIFNYTPLRMRNRCDNANPISLTEIKKR